MKKLIYILLIGLVLFTACENQDREFPDYDYTSVYFPYQTPIRTIVLGEDIYDNTLDNAHKCKIMATMGGVYENNSDRILDVIVDNTIFDSLMVDGDTVNFIYPMPANYYSLADNMQIVIPSGSLSGGIEVQLSDAFFADPRSVIRTYVIPLRIQAVTGADSILRGQSLFPGANLFEPTDWSVVPKDYVLYCIKYVNPWHGSYLRRGVDEGRGSNGNTALDTTIIKHNEYVERDQVVRLNTVSMDEVSLSLITRHKGSLNDISFLVRIKFDDSGNCSVSAPADSTYLVTGTGKFVKDGDMWGGEERDVLYLDYSVDFDSAMHTFVDTMVLRDRAVTMETFDPVKFNK